MGWNREIDYEEAVRRLKRAYAEAATAKRKGVIAVLLVQVSNGCRVSEALEAVSKFAATKKREVKVKVRKRKGETDRIVIIPSIISSHDIALPSKRSVQSWAAKLGFGNTHSLRYAFITYLAKRGVSAQIIARITGHAKLDHVLHYTEKIAAEQLLRELIK